MDRLIQNQQQNLTPKEFGECIVEWFSANKRDLPWRRAEFQTNPYAIWISEVMLQQTQADRVVPFFVKFMERFPTVATLASAPWEEVMEYVRGLGYYRRFRNVITGARIIMQEFDGTFPSTYENLRRIPGVGEYTAGAILSFACGEDRVAMDTNVRQMLRHFFDPSEEKTDAHLKCIADEACPAGRAREFYQGLMDYAASELKSLKNAKKIKKNITAFFQKRVTRKITGVPVIKVAAGIIWRKNERGVEVLIQKRTNKKYQNNLYEFPGGKLEHRESERACLKRELFEELGIEAAVRPPFLRTEHHYGDRYVKLSWHRCQILLGEPFGKEGQEIAWVRMDELSQYEFPAADDEVIRELLS